MVNDELGRGISFGGALDGEGGDGTGWLEEWHFDLAREAGFDTVRLPVKWSSRTQVDHPHAIDPALFAGTDRVVDRALSLGQNIIVTVHHFDELIADADGQEERYLAMWSQIADRYADASPRLRFEQLNEPHDPMTAATWNELLTRTLEVVRRSNPTRTVIVGPVLWNTVGALPSLRLPLDDHLITTVHYYSPFAFTHQGATWIDGADHWLGTRWGTAEDRERVRRDLTGALAIARALGHPLFLGEFGAYRRAEADDRVAWTGCVRVEAERLGLSWCYWDFGTDFGVYDIERAAWNEPLRDALLGPPVRP